MTDNTFNLDELNELKQAYQLIDEKLDGKEIVTTEQIRTVTLKNISFFKRVFKRDFSWTYLAFMPLLILVFAIEHVLTQKAICVLGIYLLVEFLLRFMLIRKMNRVDHSTLDLKTMLEEENSYMKASIAIACFGYLFWTAFNYIFISSTVAIVFLVIVLLMLLTKTDFFRKRFNIRTIATPVEPSEPGKIRRIFLWITSTLLAVVIILMLTGVGYNVFNGNINLMELCHRAGMIICCIALVLQGFFLKKIRRGEAQTLAKITSILLIIAIVLSLISVVNLLITKSTVEYTQTFPLLIGILVLYSNNANKKK